MKKLALQVVAVCALVVVSVVFERRGAYAADLGPKWCAAGMENAAQAERKRDASDNLAAIPLLQLSIESFGDCITELTVQGTQHARLTMDRAQMRLYLVEAFESVGRTRDAMDQASRMFGDVLYVCQNKVEIPHALGGNLILISYGYQALARRLRLPNVDAIGKECTVGQ